MLTSTCTLRVSTFTSNLFSVLFCLIFPYKISTDRLLLIVTDGLMVTDGLSYL